METCSNDLYSPLDSPGHVPANVLDSQSLEVETCSNDLYSPLDSPGHVPANVLDSQVWRWKLVQMIYTHLLIVLIMSKPVNVRARFRGRNWFKLFILTSC